MLAYSATTKVGVSVNLDCVFAKIPTNVFMVLYANVIRIVAKEASAILNLDVQGIPTFRDFTIRDPLYFVILFQ